MARLTIRRGGPKAEPQVGHVSSIPVKTEETQQLETLLYLVANALDAKLERGFAGGIMLKEGGKSSDFLLSVGLGLIEGEATEQRAVDTLVEHTKQEKARTMVIQKLKKLFARLEEGKKTHRTDRYFSFSTVSKAEEATRLLEGYGFGVKYKPGSRGFEIISLPENITESISALKKDIVEETKNAFRNNEEAALAFRRAERESTTRDLFADLGKVQAGKIASLPKRRELSEEEYQALREARGMHPIEAANMILKTIIAPMVSSAQQTAVRYLLGRNDVVEELRKLPQQKEFTWFSFEKLTDKEYKEFIKFLRGEMKGEVALKSTGGEPAWLRKYHAARGGSRESFEPWQALSIEDIKQIERINYGLDATFIRASNTSAAETIAVLEREYPGRAITWERSPESIRGGGHWEIRVLEEGKRAPSIEQWLNSNFATASKDDSFYKIAAIAIAGGRSKLSFNREEMPKWLGTVLDLKRSREEGALVFREDFRRKLASRGVEVPESIKGTPVYGSGKRRRTEPNRMGEKPTTVEYNLVFSGRGFQRTLELARVAEAKKADAERKEELAARKREKGGEA